MMSTLYKQQHAKGTCPVEATSNSEKIKPIALVVIELGLVEDISQTVRQKTLNTKFQKLCNNLMKVF